MKSNAYGTLWRTKNVHLLAFFTLVYVGVEVTTGGTYNLYTHHLVDFEESLGWIVTYIIKRRAGGPSSGYVSSGFFGGLAFGRVALLWVNHKVCSCILNLITLT